MSERPEILFPDGFEWGAATAAYQIEGAVHEGGREPSVWDTFAHTPGKVAHGHTGDVACDHYHRAGDDVALMSELGLDTYRFSISWSRVQPDGRGKLNDEGVAWYSDLIDRLLAAGITPCPTLFHWDLPQALGDIGGFRNRDVASWFADYAARMAGRLGDRVTRWSTFNEPWCHAYLGHASGHHAPGVRDPRAAIAVAHHQLVAHGLGLEAMRAERAGFELGIVHNPAPVRSEGSPPASDDDLRRIDALHNRWWFDATLTASYPADLLDDLSAAYGTLDELIRPGDLDQIAQPLDWIGINYYSDLLFRAAPRDADRPMRMYPTAEGARPAATRSVHTDMGWPITPDGFTELLIGLRDEYPNLPPLFVTENGCAYDDPVVDGRCADTRRIEYLDLHLRALHDAIAAGVDVRGYYHWSLMDNFEWAFGYDKRFGLIHVDFDTLERTPKDSAAWYRDVIAANGVPAGRG